MKQELHVARQARSIRTTFRKTAAHVSQGMDAMKHTVFPRSWAELLREMALATFLICAVSGILLGTMYDPSSGPTIYHGAFEPLRGIRVSEALDSTLRISFETPGGLLLRQVHNWSASLLIATLILDILRVYFTGGFRAAGKLGWVIRFALLAASMGAGLTGTILPDDMLSGSSLAVLDGILKSLPVVGLRLSDLVFQGRFPAGALATIHPVHLVVLPLLIAVLFAVLLVLGLRGVARRTVVPAPAAYRRRRALAALSRVTGTFLITCGVVTALASVVPMNPVWMYGPGDPGAASAGAGAVWYVAFLDGAQRLVPPGWELVIQDRTVVLALLVPVLACGAFFLAAAAYPFVESLLTRRDRRRPGGGRPHHHPTRTGVGVAAIVFYGTLWAAAGSDVIALQLQLSNRWVIHSLQAWLFLGPVLGFLTTRWICSGISDREAEIAREGIPTGRIVRSPDGGYHDVRVPRPGSGLVPTADSRQPSTTRK